MSLKKSYIITCVMLAATLMFGGCMRDLAPITREEALQQPSNLAVGFDAYLLRSQESKAGVAGDMTLAELKKNAGFGVFAYHHNDPYNGALAPGFMYNEKVSFLDGRWQYNPIKYWPNNGEKLSFFAYAPWIQANEASGMAANDPNRTGIVGFSRSTDTGDPLVHYVAAPILNSGVDLCWADATDLKDMERPPVTDSVRIQFSHATSKLNVQIDALVDDNADQSLDPNTRIYVRSLTMKGFAMQGTLNLNSGATPDWNGVSMDTWLSHDAVTFYDGRLDGEEGACANESEPLIGINPQLIQSKRWDLDTAPGVTTTPLNFFTPQFGFSTEEQLNQAMYVVPTGDPVSLRIEYDIETEDELVSTLSDGYTPGISLPCRIKQTAIPGMDRLEAGKYYRLLLHLGLYSVKLEAQEMRGWNSRGDGMMDFTTIASISIWTNGGVIDNIGEENES